MKIGVVGIGKMGAAIAERLLGQGHEVTVWNRTAAKTSALTKAGAFAAKTPAELAQMTSILRGGVHYRDVFDTNLPGIDWSMAAIRLTCGWSYEVLRIGDLLIVAATVGILAKVSNRQSAWFAAAVAMWYPFTSEFNHCQRDVWMLLPASAAMWLRTPVHAVPFAPAFTCSSHDHASGSDLMSQ